MKPRAIATTLLGVAAAACSDATEPANELSLREIQALAPQMDQFGAHALDGLAFGWFVRPGGAGEFSHTYPAPRGGTVSLAGSMQLERDESSRTSTMRMSTTKTQVDCALETRGGVIVALNGNPNEVMTGTRTYVEGRPSGPQTTTHKGSFRWSRAGATGVCDIDVTSTFDPVTRTHSIKGTSCGRQIDRSVTLPARG